MPDTQDPQQPKLSRLELAKMALKLFPSVMRGPQAALESYVASMALVAPPDRDTFVVLHTIPPFRDQVALMLARRIRLAIIQTSSLHKVNYQEELKNRGLAIARADHAPAQDAWSLVVASEDTTLAKEVSKDVSMKTLETLSYILVSESRDLAKLLERDFTATLREIVTA